jgi:hypothetical protein
MKNDETVFMIVMSIITVGSIWLVGSTQSNRNEQLAKEVEACEKSGGVYVDNMRRMRKYTDHEYVCMNKNMFIFPEGEK